MTTLVDQKMLAEKLRLSARRLQQLEHEHVIVRDPRDPRRYDLEVNVRRYQWFKERKIERALVEVEQAAESVEQFMQQIQDEPDVDERRRLVSDHGACIGRLDGAMMLANAMRPESERPLLNQYTTLFIGSCTNILLELCRWQLAD